MFLLWWMISSCQSCIASWFMTIIDRYTPLGQFCYTLLLDEFWNFMLELYGMMIYDCYWVPHPSGIIFCEAGHGMTFGDSLCQSCIILHHTVIHNCYWQLCQSRAVLVIRGVAWLFEAPLSHSCTVWWLTVVIVSYTFLGQFLWSQLWCGFLGLSQIRAVRCGDLLPLLSTIPCWDNFRDVEYDRTVIEFLMWDCLRLLSEA